MLKKVSEPPPVEAAPPAAEVAVLRPADEPVSKPETGRGRAFVRFLGRFALVILQAVLMVAILFGSYMLAKRMIAGKPEARKRPPFKTVYTVQTVKTVRNDHQPIFTAYGQTIAARSVELRSLVSGEIVSVNPKLRAGGRVEEGEALIEIDKFDYRGALAEAQANYQEAQARVTENEAQIALERSKLSSAQEQLEFAQADLERAERLRQGGTMTQQQLEARKLVVSQREQALAVSRDTITVQEARLDQLKASLDRLEWRVQQAQRNLASTVLAAPFDGIVRTSTAEVGRAITANDVVVSLYEAGSLEVTFTLTDAQYGRLQTSPRGLTDRKIELIWSVGGEEYTFPGVIDRTGAEIASNRGGVEVIGRLEEITSGVTLRPGAFVEVRVPDLVFSRTMSIPDTAVYGGDTVYTVVDDKLVENKVTIAAYDGESALVSNGLETGDEVLTTRITEVSAGLNVRREGDAARAPSTGSGQNAGQAENRPSREEMAAILATNNMTAEQFRTLPRDERRALVARHRQERDTDGSEPAAGHTGD